MSAAGGSVSPSWLTRTEKSRRARSSTACPSSRRPACSRSRASAARRSPPSRPPRSPPPGFVAGAATVAVVSRHRTKRAAKKRKKSGPLGEIVVVELVPDRRPPAAPRLTRPRASPRQPRRSSPPRWSAPCSCARSWAALAVPARAAVAGRADAPARQRARAAAARDGAPVVVAVSGTVFAARAADGGGGARRDRADALRGRHRRRPRGLPRALPRRPGDRPRGPRAPVAARAPQPGPVGGADVGDHRAADRHAARDRDPAAHDRRARAARYGALRDSPPARDDRGLRAGRARGLRLARASARWRMRRPRARSARGAASRSASAGHAAADFARLLAIPEIGTWTVEMLALHGLGRLDVVPAGDLGYLKLVGRLTTGNPRRSPTRPRCAGSSRPTRRGPASPALVPQLRARTLPGPRRAGTRWSAAAPRRAAA